MTSAPRNETGPVRQWHETVVSWNIIVMHFDNVYGIIYVVTHWTLVIPL